MTQAARIQGRKMNQDYNEVRGWKAKHLFWVGLHVDNRRTGLNREPNQKNLFEMNRFLYSVIF